MRDSQYQQTKKVTLIGAAVDLALGVSKIAVGIASHSQALIADGVHSLSDLVTDGLVLWAAKHGSQEADAEHPYGHQRIETVATVLLGVALILVAMGIVYDAARRLFFHEVLDVPGYLAVAVALVSIVAKEGIFRYTMRTARRFQSKILSANAWHSRSDALSSVVVLIGILGSMAGMVYLDGVAAIIVAAMIIHVGWRLGWDSVHELIDTGLEKSLLEEMRSTMLSIEGVRDVHELRTRRMGSQVFADVHVIVDPMISVSEGHRISEEVERALYDALDSPTDITVHVDCEEDQEYPPALLPLRHEIMPGIRESWAEICDIPIERVILHYLRGRVGVELRVRLAEDQDVDQIRQSEQKMQERFHDDPVIRSVAVVMEFG